MVDAHEIKLESNNLSRTKVPINATFIQKPKQAPLHNRHPTIPPLASFRPSLSLLSFLPIFDLTVPVTGRRRRREERDASILLASFSRRVDTDRVCCLGVRRENEGENHTQYVEGI